MTGMDFFNDAKVIKLRSHHDKYLLAEEDEQNVVQDKRGSSRNAKWLVEFVLGFDNLIRLKSCYGKYLTASNQPFLLGTTGRKVLQTLPRRLDSSLEWEPLREGTKIMLKTRYGNYLRTNGGLPPWRNSVTHDIPNRSSTKDCILWEVDIIEIDNVKSSIHKQTVLPSLHRLDSFEFYSNSPQRSFKSRSFSRQASFDSSTFSSPPKCEGRTIYYHIAEENGEVDEAGVEGYSFTFKGNGVEELKRKLGEETGLVNAIVCTRSPLNGKLYPLRLQLPPNNANMHVILILPESEENKMSICECPLPTNSENSGKRLGETRFVVSCGSLPTGNFVISKQVSLAF